LAVIAVAAGLVVLIGYFLPMPLLGEVRALFLHWAMILFAIALIVGVINLARVHWLKVARRQPGYINSLALILALLFLVVVVGYFGPISPVSIWIFNYIQVPLESSLMALLVVVLALGGARLFGRHLSLFSVIFIFSALITLLGSVSIIGFSVPGLDEFAAWLSRVPATAGARGILLGVALGAVATGLRILTGSDRPYGG